MIMLASFVEQRYWHIRPVSFWRLTLHRIELGDGRQIAGSSGALCRAQKRKRVATVAISNENIATNRWQYRYASKIKLLQENFKAPSLRNPDLRLCATSPGARRFSQSTTAYKKRNVLLLPKPITTACSVL